RPTVRAEGRARHRPVVAETPERLRRPDAPEPGGAVLATREREVAVPVEVRACECAVLREGGELPSRGEVPDARDPGGSGGHDSAAVRAELGLLDGRALDAEDAEPRFRARIPDPCGPVLAVR